MNKARNSEPAADLTSFPHSNEKQENMRNNNFFFIIISQGQKPASRKAVCEEKIKKIRWVVFIMKKVKM